MEADRSLSSPPLRFGVFELDTSTGELRKQGFRVRLRGQPVEILRLLLEKNGAVVTRQEMRDRLWPDNVHVDFDRSVNKAFVKLREALGDDASSPRFIETLPRVGYRFIAPVEAVAPASPVPRPIAGPPPKARTAMRAWLLGAAVVVAAAAVVLVRSFAPAAPRVVATVPLTHSADVKWGPLLASPTALYFDRQKAGEQAMRLPISGGEATVVETPFPWSELFGISPDGVDLLVGEVPADPRSAPGYALWIVPGAGGSARRVGDVRADAATWSPDGQRIFFVRGPVIAAVSRDGTGRREILKTTGELDLPHVSPDGRTIRFDRATKDGAHIWEVGVDGTGLRRAFPAISGTNGECCGTWTRDGRAFVFQASGGGRSNLWIAIGRRPPAPLTAGPMNLELPAAGAAGSRIFAIGVQAQGELVRWDAATRRFEPFLDGISAEGVSFSADGAWVAYTSYPEGILYRSRSDGSERISLTSLPLRAMLPQLSPDGRRVAFVGWLPRREPEVFVVDSDGGAPARLLPGEQKALLPAWSPDGRSLAFSGSLHDPAGVRILDVATGKVRLLPGSAAYAGPVWSRDGSFLLAAALSPSRIVRYDFAKVSWSEVTRRPFNYFSLSRDGKFVYFDTRWELDPAVYRVPSAGGPVERVADLKGIRRAAGFAGMWFDLAPDDSPLVLRDTSSRQIYAIDWK